MTLQIGWPHDPAKVTPQSAHRAGLGHHTALALRKFKRSLRVATCGRAVTPRWRGSSHYACGDAGRQTARTRLSTPRWRAGAGRQTGRAGFKKTESKQVVANVARDATVSMEELLRRAFALLVPG